MNAPISLGELFQNKLLRIPDYQRGYAWQKDQLIAFWEDLINLPADGRYHYTGMITLKELPANAVNPNDKEYWLVEDQPYKLYEVVDGQQRLTTFVVWLKSLLDFVAGLPDNLQKNTREIFLTENLSIHEIENQFLFRVKPTGGNYRTYILSYGSENSSDKYFRYRILGEEGKGEIQETFYTLNLSVAKSFFTEQIRGYHESEGIVGIQSLYRKATKRLMFIEHVIDERFNVFVSFETMNNRGMQLSNLELLKNRLIYLTTLYSDLDLDTAGQKNARDEINDAWKEVYRQLGRNKTHPLNDDEFLRAHWILFFPFNRERLKEYNEWLLQDHFSPKRVHHYNVSLTNIELPTVIAEDAEYEIEAEDITEAISAQTMQRQESDLRPAEIQKHVTSIKECAVHWFNSWFPSLASDIEESQIRALEALNRIGIAYFRPLVVAILKTEADVTRRIVAFRKIERFILVAFRFGWAGSTWKNPEFSRIAGHLYRKEWPLDWVLDRLDANLNTAFHPDGALRIDSFHNLLKNKFDRGVGYYGWWPLRYFLFEYELSLLEINRQVKVTWEDLLRSPQDSISIEHIYPQTPVEEWNKSFEGVAESELPYWRGSLGNLLLLSFSINASLQNDSFEDKKHPKLDAKGKKIRHGYSDGSHWRRIFFR